MTSFLQAIRPALPTCRMIGDGLVLIGMMGFIFALMAFIEAMR